MSTSQLLAYARARIEVLGLGANGQLREQYIVVRDDGSGMLFITDGFYIDDEISTREQVDASLATWLPLLAERA